MSVAEKSWTIERPCTANLGYQAAKMAMGGLCIAATLVTGLLRLQ